MILQHMKTNKENYILRFERYLQDTIDTMPIPSSTIKEAVLYALFPGGKRIRPLLVYLCGELLVLDIRCLDIISAAIELTHCYSLIHDDLPSMDDDDFRRGKPSCHRAFDEATAILAGDGMQSLAIELLLTQLPKHLPDRHVVNISRELVRASGVSGMVSGQCLDLNILTQNEISEKQLRQIHQLKTGYLIASCINMVLFAQPVNEEKTKGLKKFAERLGLVFQMQDDYLDHYSNILGKGRSSDEANQKTTFASLYEQKELYDLIHHYYQQAHQVLQPFGNAAQPLHQLLNDLESRSVTT